MINIKKFKKIIKIIFLIIIPINLIFLIIFYDGNLRYSLMRMVGESSNIITELKLFRAIEQRNFPQGLKLLDQQLDRTQGLSPGNNKLLKSLIENIKYSFNGTVSIEDRDYFELFLKKMVRLYPDIYSLRIWYAQTLENNDPNELYKQIDDAISILSSDSKAYRIGINSAFRNQDNNKLKTYCSAYYTNQLGGIKYAEIGYVFPGIGLRSIAIELLDNNQKIFVKNNGVNLAKSKEYEFLIPRNIDIKSNIKLHVAITDGIQLDLKKLSFFSQGYKTSEYLANEISFITENSFVDDKGSIMLLTKFIYSVLAMKNLKS